MSSHAAARRGPREPGRWWIALSLVVVLAVFVPCLLNALAWVDRPFAGFLFLDSGVVISIGRAEWVDPRRRRAEWTRVLAVDGAPVSGGREIHDYVRRVGIGRQVTYTFRGGTEMFRLAMDVRAFAWRDFFELFAPMLAVGLLMIVFAAVVVLRRPAAPEARALFAVCTALGVLLITGPDQYAPYRFLPLYFLSFSAVAPAFGHLALTYPERSSLWPRHGALAYVALYAPFAGLALALYVFRLEQAFFLPLLYAAYFFSANAIVLYSGRLVFGIVNGLRPWQPLALAFAGIVGAALVSIAIIMTYPLLQRPISPAAMLVPWLLCPTLTGVALLRFPRPTAP